VEFDQSKTICSIIILYDNYIGIEGCRMTLSIREYQREDGIIPFREWLKERDPTTKARIQARIFRFEQGNLGDHKHLGKGIWEARLDFGPGYRLYFGKNGKAIILLLLGGDKNTQAADIWTAQIFWKDYQEVKHGSTK